MKRKLYLVVRNCYIGRTFFTAGYQVRLTDEEAKNEIEASKIEPAEEDAVDEPGDGKGSKGSDNDELSRTDKAKITRARNKAIKIAETTIKGVKAFLNDKKDDLSEDQVKLVSEPLQRLEASIDGDDIDTDAVNKALAEMDDTKNVLSKQLESNAA